MAHHSPAIDEYPAAAGDARHPGITGGTKGAAGAAAGATFGGVLDAAVAALAATGLVIASGGTLLVAEPAASGGDLQ